MTFLLALLLPLLATLAGWTLSSRLRWTAGAPAGVMAAAAAFALGPLLAGLAVLAALAVWPGASHAVHVIVTILLLGVAASPSFLLLRGRRLSRLPHDPTGLTKAIAALAAGFVVALAVDSATMPLIQNDALEYAIAARELFAARDLGAYPVLDSTRSPSGFFGPWTHPPLYVALIYLMSSIQGAVDPTGLMRIVAPWSLIAAAGVTFAMARMVSKPAAYMAAALVLSTPLLYLGSASALIDALPVLGFALVFMAMAGLDASSAWRYAAGCAVACGLAMWTHSQAVLFPFLIAPAFVWLMWPRRSAPRRHVAVWGALAMVFAGAVALSWPPYARNTALFGSPISDTPAVFAHEALGFADYFRVQRGLGSAGEWLQYGLLKGFFAPEAYGLLFWLALPALVACWAATIRDVRLGNDELTAAQRVGRLSALVVGSYLAAAALSSAVGVDLMVRNERYMLVLAPCLACLAAKSWPGAQVADQRRLHRISTGALVAVLALQLGVMVTYRLSQVRASASASSTAALERWGPHAAVAYLRDNTPADALVLSMKPADMFYASRRMVSYLDPRMLTFYDQRDPVRAAAMLRSMGITHVHMPDYTLPPAYNSALLPILADANLSTLAFEHAGYQIYRLRDTQPVRLAGDCTTVPWMDSPWTRRELLVLGGRKSLVRWQLSEQGLAAGMSSGPWNRSAVFLRESSVTLNSRPVSIRTDESPALNEATVAVRLHGEGYIQVAIWRRQPGQSATRQLLLDRPLARSDSSLTVERRIRLAGSGEEIALEIEHRAMSEVTIDEASITTPCVASSLPG